MDSYRRHGAVIRTWAENQVTDRSLARLGAASFARIATTLQASMVDPDHAGDPPRTVALRAVALLAMIERFAYVSTSRDLGFGDDRLLDNLALVVNRGFFRARG